MDKKKTIEDIFNDDEFGLLDAKPKVSHIKTEDDRLVDSFEEINDFFEKNNREPNSSNMSEYQLLARLKTFRSDEKKKATLKPYDRFNLLGVVETNTTIDDILNDDDLGLLEVEEDVSIFKFKHTPKPTERAESDKNIEKNLIVGNFYVVDGLLLYLEDANLETDEIKLTSGNRVRKDGRTRTIFENATMSNMLYRSLGKQIQKNGKLVTNTETNIERELFENANLVEEADIETGWIYVLKSKSTNPKISSIDNLYKIGFSKTEVAKRIQNAVKEATYLFADVELVSSYKCYNLNPQVFENLVHRFFAESCLNIDLYEPNGNRIVPREWFVVPLDVINSTIDLIINGNIINYKYDIVNQRLTLK